MSKSIRKLVFSALFLALCLVLPLLTAQLQKLGQAMLPMHLPVLLCGFICGPAWGAAVGLIAPILRSLIFGMPPIFPTAVCMAAELCGYGLFAGLFYKLFPKKIGFTYLSLVLAMICGRIVNLFAHYLIVWTGLTDKAYTLAIFWADSVVAGLIGMAIQIVLIPPIVLLFKRLHYIGD